MPESAPIIIEGVCYQRGWVFGFLGEKNRKHYSITACLPPGVDLDGKRIKMTIEVEPKRRL